MNDDVLKYHQSLVAKANIAVLELASLLVMGKVPKDTPDAVAGCRKALGELYVPWVIPLIECSKTLKLTKLAGMDLVTLDHKKRSTWVTVALEHLIGEVNGFTGLNAMIEHILPIMEDMADITQAIKTKLRPDAEPVTDEPTHTQEKESEESVEQAIERVVDEETKKAGDEDLDGDVLGKRIIAALAALGIEVSVEAVAIKPDGSIKGSLDNFPADIQAHVRGLQEALKGKHTVN